MSVPSLRFLFVLFVALVFGQTSMAQVKAVGSQGAKEANPLVFSKACEPGDSVMISAVGDFLFHDNLQIQAAAARNRYLSIWDQIVPLFAQAQIRYGNLELGTLS